jgi:hypothetical protein
MHLYRTAIVMGWPSEVGSVLMHLFQLTIIIGMSLNTKI